MLVSNPDRSGSQQSLYVRCLINSHECWGLIDTGSEINMLPSSIADGLPLTACSQELRTASGREILVKGEIVTRVKFNCRCKRLVRFVVYEEVEEVMLGTESMTGCRVSLQRNELFVGRCRLHRLRQDRAEICHRILAAGNREVFLPCIEESPSRVDDGEHERISSHVSCQAEHSRVHDTTESIVEFQNLQHGNAIPEVIGKAKSL